VVFFEAAAINGILNEKKSRGRANETDRVDEKINA